MLHWLAIGGCWIFRSQKAFCFSGGYTPGITEILLFYMVNNFYPSDNSIIFICNKTYCMHVQRKWLLNICYSCMQVNSHDRIRIYCIGITHTNMKWISTMSTCVTLTSTSQPFSAVAFNTADKKLFQYRFNESE